MAIGTEFAVQAIELEAFVEEIADLQQHFDRLQTKLEKGGKKVQISNTTVRGTTSRSPFWVPIRVQGGAGIQQFAADTRFRRFVASWHRILFCFLLRISDPYCQRLRNLESRAGSD